MLSSSKRIDTSRVLDFLSWIWTLRLSDNVHLQVEHAAWKINEYFYFWICQYPIAHIFRKIHTHTADHHHFYFSVLTLTYKHEIFFFFVTRNNKKSSTQFMWGKVISCRVHARTVKFIPKQRRELEKSPSDRSGQRKTKRIFDTPP